MISQRSHLWCMNFSEPPGGYKCCNQIFGWFRGGQEAIPWLALKTVDDEILPTLLQLDYNRISRQIARLYQISCVILALKFYYSYRILEYRLKVLFISDIGISSYLLYSAIFYPRYFCIRMLNKNSLAVKKCKANQKPQWL